MLSQWLLANLYNILVTAVGAGGIFGYLTEKKKRIIAEQMELSLAKKGEADALETIQSVYDKFTSDSLDRYIDLKAQLDALKEQLELVTAELIKVNIELEKEKRNSSLLKIAHQSLKKTCEQYVNSKKSRK